MFFQKPTALLIMIAGCTSICQATTTEELIEQAELSVAKDEHKKALKTYKKIDIPNYDILYKMGNSAHALKKYSKALWYWRSAERQPNWSSRIKLFEKIQNVQQHLKTPTHSKPRPYDPIINVYHCVINFTYSMLISLPMLFLQMLFLILWFSLSFLSRRPIKHQAKNSWRLGTTFAVAMLLGARYFVDRRTWAIVSKDNVVFRSGPGNQYPELRKLPQGCEIPIYDARSGFYKVQFGKLRGWVDETKVLSIAT
jgi:hypothetical protein